MLANDIAKLMAMIPLQDDSCKINNGDSEPQTIIKGMTFTIIFMDSQGKSYVFFIICVGGAFKSVQDTASPFGYKRGEGIDAGKGETGWVVARERQKYDAVFTTLEKSDGKLSGAGMCY